MPHKSIAQYLDLIGYTPVFYPQTQKLEREGSSQYVWLEWSQLSGSHSQTEQSKT